MTTARRNRDASLKEIAPIYRRLRGDLLRTEKILRGIASGADREVTEIVHYVVSSSGKRLRPLLVLLGSRLKGPGHAEPSKVLRVAAAAELIHLATLVHDDIIDGAAMRHLKPTVAVHNGRGSAVLIGDYLYAQATRLLANLDRLDVVKNFTEASIRMCEGEISQVRRRRQFDLTAGEYFNFIDYKTAMLMGASVRAGGQLCGLGADAQAALGVYGRNLGMAFQVIDDLLDLVGEERLVGKTLRTDLLNTKMTLPIILLRDQLNASGKAELRRCLRDPRRNWKRILGMVKTSGIPEQCVSMADEMAGRAKRSLDRFPATEARTSLVKIADFVCRRRI